MRRIDLKSLSLFLLITFYTIFISILYVDNYVKYYNLIINPIVWLIFFIISICFFKDENFRIKMKIDKAQTVFVIILIYIIFYSLSGLIFGYSKSIYSHSFISIIKNLWSYVLIIISKEYVRYFLVNKNEKNKLFNFLIFLIFVLIDINFVGFEKNFVSGEVIFKYVSTSIIPIIAQNMLFMYLTKNSGVLAVLSYRLPLAFYNIVNPIFPDLDWFMISLYELSLAFICFVVINYVHSKKVMRESRKSVRKQKYTKSLPFVIVLFIFVSFVAGLFKYMPVGIMSNSMAKLINRGDLVVVEKLNSKEKDNLEIGDIIEYQLQQEMIVHRIIYIDKNKEGEINYITMGDNNNAPDNKKVPQKNVIAKVKFNIPYIGYPIVILNDIFSKTKPDVEMGKK